MDPAKYVILLNRIACGEFDCLCNCTAEQLFNFAAIVQSMNDADLRLFVGRMLCCAQATDPRGNPLPSLDPRIPRRQRDPNATPCDMRQVVCTSLFQAKIAALETVLGAASAAGLNATTFPALSPVFDVLDRITKICTHPDTPPDFAQQAEICDLVEKMEDIKLQLGSKGLMGKAIADSIQSFLSSETVKAIRECCFTNPNMTPRAA